MVKFAFKKEDSLSSMEVDELENLLVPHLSWSYHFSQSFEKNCTLYYDSKPTWRLLFYNDDVLAGSLSIVKRDIYRPMSMTIGGIGNFVVDKTHQGRGFGRLALQRSHQFMKEKGLSFSLLFCVDKLQPFYMKAGYEKLKNRVEYNSKGVYKSESLGLIYPLNTDGKELTLIQDGIVDIGDGTW